MVIRGLATCLKGMYQDSPASSNTADQMLIPTVNSKVTKVIAMLARVPKAFLSSDFIMPYIFESETGLT